VTDRRDTLELVARQTPPGLSRWAGQSRQHRRRTAGPGGALTARSRRLRPGHHLLRRTTTSRYPPHETEFRHGRLRKRHQDSEPEGPRLGVRPSGLGNARRQPGRRRLFGGVAVAEIETRVKGGGSRAQMQSAEEACESLLGGAQLTFGPGPR
jgi:hypothetical protein